MTIITKIQTNKPHTEVPEFETAILRSGSLENGFHHGPGLSCVIIRPNEMAGRTALPVRKQAASKTACTIPPTMPLELNGILPLAPRQRHPKHKGFDLANQSPRRKFGEPGGRGRTKSDSEKPGFRPISASPGELAERRNAWLATQC